MKNLTVVLVLLIASLALYACETDYQPINGGCLDPGQITFGAEQGADLCTGTVLAGSHATDIWAVDAGGKLALMSGGDTSTKPRPVNWLNPGGYQKAYDSLSMVPSEEDDFPTDPIGITLQKAKEHGGFILMRSDGTWVKGWFSSLSTTHVTIQFETISVPEPEPEPELRER
jgi:hypothetical protein